MFPSPWASSVSSPVTKSMANSYENNVQPYPFYTAPNAMQNISQMNQQNSLTLNTASIMTQSLQPNAIDPAMVQKWQEWKQWEVWQQQFQRWQQQTGQINTAIPQPAPPSMPPNQSLQHSTTPFQNQPYPYNQSRPPLPLTNQIQQIDLKNEVGMKRGLEPELQNNEKKLKVDVVDYKKDVELNAETEALFEEQFKSWEEQFDKWKEQNKNHPDKAQYLEYEKKWINWRDHLKQKCELLKKKRELKMAEKKKETIQAEESKLHSQQRSSYNPVMSNMNALMTEPPPNSLHMHNSSMIPPNSENQIPGLDLVSNNESAPKEFLNVSRILPQNSCGPIQTPDDKPFNFPKSMTNPALLNTHSINMPPGSMNQPPTSMYQNTSSWSKYNNPVHYYNQKLPDVDNASISRFGQQTDISTRPPYSGDKTNSVYNNSQHISSMNYKRPLEGSYHKPSNESSIMYNTHPDDPSYKRNLNLLSSNVGGYNQPNANTSNFNRPPEKLNNLYLQSTPSSNTTTLKPPSLLSLNLVKPITLDKPGNYLDDTNAAPSNRYERNWNIADEEDDPENEYMEAHKKFSSEPFDDQNNDDHFSNKQPRHIFNDKHYSRGQQDTQNFDDDYLRPFSHPRGSQMMRNIDQEYHRPNSQYSKNIGQSYSRDMQLHKNEDDYYKTHNNPRNSDQRLPHKRTSLLKDVDEYSDEPVIDKNNFVPYRGNYGPPSRGNYEYPRGNFGNNKNITSMEFNKDYAKNEEPQPIRDKIVSPPVITKMPPYEEAPPIDPVKIFDYRHLPTLKVIPGLSKETVVPIRVYDYKHGGKRILPWQDRGYSRRNSNQIRDLNEKEGANQINTDDLDKNKETVIRKPTFSTKNILLDKIEQNVLKSKVSEINEEIPTTIDAITTTVDDKDEKPQPKKEIIDLRAPSPPKMKKFKEVEKLSNRQLLTIETLLCPPGRLNRPSKIVIILRGLPGSGKSHVAKLIKDKEVAMGGQAPRILSLDDYFMTEVTKIETDPETNKMVERKVMEYEHDSANENLYRTSFIKAFKKKILENYYSFYIIDAINNKVTYYKDILDISRINGFTVYIIELELDVDLCIKRNIHNRTAHDINSIMRSWVKTPDDQILLDIRSLLHSPSKSEMDMEDVSDIEMELDKDDTVDDSKLEKNTNVDFEEEDVMKLLSCKWIDNIPQEEKMKRLDGLCKKKTENSIKEWLQIPEDEYTINEQVVVKDGKKRVRWADMEERREQEKMRAIGFVVGQTDWDRMLGRDQGESKLTQTKYI